MASGNGADVIRRPISRTRATVLAILSVVVLVGAYTYLSHQQFLRNPNDSTIPGWGKMWSGFLSTISVQKRSGEIWLYQDVWATFGRLLMGLGLGSLGAILLGLAMGCSRSLEAFLLPPLSLLAKVPPTAAMAVFFVMSGTGTTMFVTMIAFGVLPVMAQSVYLAARDVPDELLFKAYTLGASDAEVVCHVVVPYVLPKILDSLRLQIGPAMVYLIAAEMLVGDVGFGYRIRIQQRLLNMQVVYPYLALLAASGFAMDKALKRLHRALCPWTQDGH